MNKLVFGALAATLVGSVGYASESEDWASLDRELESLSTTLSAQSGGPSFGGYIITWFDVNSDASTNFDPDGAGPLPSESKDVQGFTLKKVRLEAKGAVDDYGYKMSVDFASGSASLKDAYVNWHVGESLNVQAGRFKSPTFRSQLVSSSRLLFRDRTSIGGTFGRDTGAMISGDFETVGWWIALQNGIDGNLEDFLVTGRVQVALMGDGPGKVEGAYGAPDETELTVAAMFQDEGSFSDSSIFGGEVVFTSGPFSAQAEVADYDKDFTPASGFMNSIGTELADNTPWDVTVSYMFNEQYEAAARWEDFDDSANSDQLTVGVNRYVDGHNIKWQLQWRSSSSDVAALEQDQVSLGLALRF